MCQNQTNLSNESAYSRRKRQLATNYQEMVEAGYDELECKICGFTSMFSLNAHIVRKHKISTKEYQEKFGQCVLQRSLPSAIKKSSETLKRILLDENKKKEFLRGRSFPSEIKHWTRKGFTEEEARSKVSEFQRSMAKRGDNPRTKQKLSEASKGKRNPMSLASIAARHGVSEEEAKKLTPCYGRTKEKHPMYGKKHKQESIDKIGKSINHNGRSKEEHELSDQLIAVLGGKKNSHAAGWCCDYVNDDLRLVVEFFGNFWHHNPSMYDSSWINPFTKRTSEFVWNRDKRKLDELHSAGYDVIVVWESDWHVRKNEIVKEIIDVYNRKL